MHAWIALLHACLDRSSACMLVRSIASLSQSYECTRGISARPPCPPAHASLPPACSCACAQDCFAVALRHITPALHSCVRFNPALLHACLRVRRIASLSRNAFSRSFHRGGTLRRFWSIGGPVLETGGGSGSSVTSAAAAALRAQQQKSRRASRLSAVVGAAPGGGKSALPSSVSMASVVSMRGGEGAEERPDLGFGLKLTLSIITITFCELLWGEGSISRYDH